MFNDYRKKENAKLFKNLLYVYLLIRCVYWLINFNLLFGANSLNAQNIYSLSAFVKPAYILLTSNNPFLSGVFIFITISVCLFSLIKHSYIILDIFLCFLVLNIHIKTYTGLTSGDSVVVNVMFLSVFLKNSFVKSESLWSQLSIALHNFSFIALIIQICIVYIYSALAKWNDTDWLNGSAIDLVNQTEHYSKGFIIHNASALKPFSCFLSWVVLIYQSLFSIMPFFKKIKNPFLLVGILIHAYIAFVMGLFFFGLIMIICYALFYEFKKQPLNN